MSFAFNPFTGKLDIVGDNYLTTTTADLATAIANSTLIPEQWYLITDYQTVDYIRQSNTALNQLEFYTGTVEQIYVQAASANEIKYEGWSKTFPGEKIGYLQDRDDYTASPDISYNPDDGSTGTVAVTPIDQDNLEITTNPYPSDPDTETSFNLNAYDRTYGISYTFDSTNKGVTWDFVTGNFSILDNNFPYYSSTDISYDGTSGNSGTQEVSIDSATVMSATTPDSTMADWIFDSNYGGYWYITDQVTGTYSYFDYVNKDITWQINGSGKFELLDQGSSTSTYVSDYSAEVTIDSATQFTVDIASFDIGVGSSNDGTTSLGIFWTDATYIYLDYTNYGTDWSVSGNTITLIGNSHDLTTDIDYMDGSVYGTDQTLLIDLESTDLYIEAAPVLYSEVPIDLTNSDINGSWTYTVQVLGSLIVNRTIPDAGIDIDFDFRATEFDRFKISAVTYDSGTNYAAGSVVNYNGTLYIKTIATATIVHPYAGTYYASWARVSPSSNYYIMGRNGFSVYGLAISPDLTSSIRTSFMQYLGADNFNIDLSILRGIKIKFHYATRTPGSDADIVLFGTNHYDSNISLASTSMVTLNMLQDCVDLKFVGESMFTGTFRNNSGTINSYLGYNLTNSKINSITQTLWYNNDSLTVYGSITNFICGGSDQSYGNTVVGSITTAISGNYCRNNTINTIYQSYVGYYMSGNFLNRLHTTTIGYYLLDNQIYSQCTGATVTQYMSNNRIYSKFGDYLQNPVVNAGSFYYIDGNDIYGDFYTYANPNIGGTTKYNNFRQFSNCVVKGSVYGNNLPITNFNRNNILNGMGYVDQIGTESDSMSYNSFYGTWYNMRFTGRTTMTYNNFFANFQNAWFGGGTFASPTDNSSYRNFTYNNAYGTFQQFNFETGYVDRNMWQGSCEAFGATWTKFNHGNGVGVQDNIFGSAYKGNQHTKQMLNCVIGVACGNNSFNQIVNQSKIGNNFITNSFTSTLTAVEIGDGVSGATIPTLNQGVKYPNLLIKGNANGGAGNILDMKNLTDLQLFLCNNAGQFSIGNTAAQGQLTVYRNTATPGTVTNSAGGTTVSGTNTIFRNTFKVGDSITIGGQTVTITVITNDTSMTVTPAITNANSGVAYTTTGIPVLVAYAHGRTGIGRTTPQKTLDISSIDGGCLRLIYNDDTGSTADSNYVDFSVSSTGDLTISPYGGNINFTGSINAVSYEDDAVFHEGSLVFS